VELRYTDSKTLLQFTTILLDIMTKYLNLLCIILFLSFLPACSETESRIEKPYAENGILDLRNWDFNQQGTVNLSGEWEFFWKQFIHSDGKNLKYSDYDSEIRLMPDSWNGYVMDGVPVTADGFASYRVKILLKEKNQNLAFRLRDIGTAYKLFINGEIVTQVGTIGKDSESSIPAYFPHVTDFIPNSNELKLVLEISNYHDIKGGMRNVIELGLEDSLRQSIMDRTVFEAANVASIFIICFYHLGLFALRRKNKSPLYFGVFCLLVGLRTITSGERYIIHLIPNLEWHTLLRIEIFSYFLAVPFFILFAASLFPDESPVKLRKLCQNLGFGISLIALLTPFTIYSKFIYPYQLFTVGVSLLALYIVIRATLEKREGARLFLCGFIVLFICVINDILFDRGIIHTLFLVHFGVIVFILLQAYILSGRFSRMFSKVEILSEELELKSNDLLNARNEMELRVMERTSELADSNRQLIKNESKIKALNTILEQRFKKTTEELKEAKETISEKEFKSEMADITTGTLHNVKNVLTSLKIAVESIEDILSYSALVGYKKANLIVKDHLGTIGEFIDNDPQGKKLIDYYLILEDAFEAEQKDIKNQLNNLRNKVDTINDLIFDQQKYGATDRISAVTLSEIVEDALNILQTSLTMQNIEITKVYREIPEIQIQKAKMLHILINLIKNAEEAMSNTPVSKREIKISVYFEDQAINLDVQDQGEGISSTKMKQLFTHGFTTKPHGYGYGLFNIRNYLEEMGGKMSVHSAGIDQGATFKIRFRQLKENSETQGSEL